LCQAGTQCHQVTIAQQQLNGLTENIEYKDVDNVVVPKNGEVDDAVDCIFTTSEKGMGCTSYACCKSTDDAVDCIFTTSQSSKEKGMGCTSYTCCKWTNTQSENITSIIQQRKRNGMYQLHLL
jgi:hypothetical protein